MTTAAKLLQVARADLGVKESPPGSNRVKYTRWYGLVGPWCAMAVSYWANKAGIPTSVIPKHAWTPAGKQFFQKQGRWGTTPRVGAIVYYNLSGLGRVSHVGIVEKVHSDGSFTAIEGNTDVRGGRTGGKVMRKRRKALGRGGGFGYPAYAAQAGGKTRRSKRKPSGYRTVKYGNMLRRGTKGAPVKEWQKKALGYPPNRADGFFGPQTEADTRRFQREHGLHADGIVGPKTWPLRKNTKHRQKPKPAHAALKVDGKLGPATKKALQRAVGVKADGIIGRTTIRGIQKRVGVKTDGVLGPNTVRGIQKRVGVKQDGRWGPTTTRALQKALNNGKF